MSQYLTHHELQTAIAPLATQRELEIWSGALVGRMDARFESLQLHIDALQRNLEAMQRDLRREIQQQIRQEIRDEIAAMRGELQADLTRHANAVFESSQAMIRALGERPGDLATR